ncbi:MAG TPA: hypothetical protein VLD67_05685 [Vicinamibacterales bacterium]|nr:hypothetical protein [Vicinamibacterales bacterium]
MTIGATASEVTRGNVESRAHRFTIGSAAVLASIVGAYAVFGLAVLSPEAVYSGDIGVKYVQARALAHHGFTSLDIPYPGEFLDPQRQFFPMRPPFVMTIDGSTQAIFPPSAAVMQAAAARAGGIEGLIVVSVVAGALILYAAARMVSPALGPAVLLSLGLGTPLWFYAISGWEHAPAVAFSTMGFMVAVRGRSPAASLAAGVLVGMAAALRDEALLLVPGMVLAASLAPGRRRSAGALLAGVVVPLALAAVVEVWWFERPAAAHLRHAVHMLQVAAHLTDQPNPDVPSLEPFTMRERYETVVNYWLAGSDADRTIAAFGIGLAAALVVRWKLKSSVGVLVWILGMAVVAAADLHEVLTAPKWLAGLFRVAPYAVLALVPARRAAAERTWLPTVVIFTAVSYIVLAFAGVDTSGGKSLGPRLLLPLVPLLAVTAVTSIEGHLRGASRADRAVGVVGVALVLMSMAFHIGGTMRAYYGRNHEDASAVRAAAAGGERVIVADDPFTAQLLFPLYYRRIVFLADSRPLGQRLGAVLAEHRVPGAVVVSRHADPTIRLDPLRLERSEQVGRMLIQHWRR